MSEEEWERQGFSGQSLVVELCDESQVTGNGWPRPSDANRGGGGELNAVLNRALDESFTYLRDLDEYGTTIFNGFQLRHVLPELHRLRKAAETESEKEVVERVIHLAERAKADVHHFLVFLGD